MAAYSNSSVRVRLHFDYPPPAVADCRMCWLLVDLNTCRVVADLESIIREKFEFSRRSVINLFIDDCYLPHTESIYVVRDNDSVRVKVDFLGQVNGTSRSPHKASDSGRKRPRPTEEEGPGENGVNVECKKKKRKKRSEESLERDAEQASVNERTKKSQGKQMEEKKKKRKKEKEGPIATPKSAVSPKNIPARVVQPVKSPKKPPVAQNVSSSDSSSSSSEEDEAPKKIAAPKSTPKAPSSAPTPPTKPPQTKPRSPSSSSSDSSSDEDTRVKPQPSTSITPKEKTSGAISKSQQAAPVLLKASNGAQKPAVVPHHAAAKSSSSSSEEEIELVIRRPLHKPGLGVCTRSSWRGRGQNGRGSPGKRGRGRGRGDIGDRLNGSFGFSYDEPKEPSYQTDALTNMSVVLQNGAVSAPKKDYSSMPLLAAPPQVGQKIAFKLLELAENYTPEVSEYKEGKIVSFDHTTKQIELEVQNASQAPAEPGKFDLVYQNADGSETVEYAVSRGSRVTERWDSLLEPRLII